MKPKTEKQQVMEYVASLPTLDRYLSDDIDLLPQSLYQKGIEYWKYENDIRQIRDAGKTDQTAIEVMESVCEIMKRNFERDLLGLLSRYGYRFGGTDSLQNNVRQRLEDLQEEYHSLEGKDATPLFVDTWCVWNDDPDKRGFRQAFQFDGNTVDGDDFRAISGLDGLVGLAGSDSGEDFRIVHVTQMYGNIYNVEVSECLLSQRVVEADNREKASAMVFQKLENERLSLDKKRFNGVDIKLQGEKGSYHLGPTLMALKEGLRHVSVTDFLVKTIQKEGRSSEEAVDAVRQDWKDGRIALGKEDFAYRVINPSFQIADNTQLLPKRLFPVTQYELQQHFRNRWPEGVTINLRNESVGHLLALDRDPDQKLVGMVNERNNSSLSAYGTLQAEIRMSEKGYAEVWPDAGIYTCGEFKEILDAEQNICTTFLYRHPAMDGGRVRVGFTPSVKDSLYVEGIPFAEAVRLIRSEGIRTDEEFRLAAGARRDTARRQEAERRTRDALKRISEVSVMRAGSGNAFIRCRIDGVQQMAVPVSSKDRILLSNGIATKEELALKYFSGELSVDRSQEQNRGLRR